MTRPVVSGVVCTAAMLMLATAPGALAQRITDVANGTLSVTVPLGSMMPGTSTTPASQTVQFRLRHTSAYKVTASAVFNVTPLAPVAGGLTLNASDIGVGITSITVRPAVDIPRTDVITSGFSYDPALVVSANGLSPYSNMAGGKATLQDIISNPGITLLTGPRISATDTATGNNYLTVTMTFGVVHQYFTPASASAVITFALTNQ